MTTKKIVLIVGGVVVVLWLVWFVLFVGGIVGLAFYSIGNSEAAMTAKDFLPEQRKAEERDWRSKRFRQHRHWQC